MHFSVAVDEVQIGDDLSEENATATTKTTRRDLIRSAVYVTPVILTLAATPSFAKRGGKYGKKKKRDRWDDGWD